MIDNLHVNSDEYLPLRDVVFNTLRQAILTGEMKPGERLMEIHLANKLGVSRTPIREAIRKLELEGLVIMIPRRGAEVAQITWKNLKDVLEVRKALDVLAIELACERMTQEELQKLCKHIDQIIRSSMGNFMISMYGRQAACMTEIQQNLSLDDINLDACYELG